MDCTGLFLINDRSATVDLYNYLSRERHSTINSYTRSGASLLVNDWDSRPVHAVGWMMQVATRADLPLVGPTARLDWWYFYRGEGLLGFGEGLSLVYSIIHVWIVSAVSRVLPEESYVMLPHYYLSYSLLSDCFHRRMGGAQCL